MKRTLAVSGLTALGLVAAALLSGCQGPQGDDGGPDPRRGAVLVEREACGACHQIPHIQRAVGRVGPPLAGMARRTIIAGYLPNTPDNMKRWIQSPQSVAPGNAMPDMGLDDRDSRDIAAFIETLD
ncbi:MAG: c-type cytochrome [Caulobacter sp.]|nr:c-type cytochrome [Caulobacter sp.]